jgi:trimethylamine--corrinoid protein Co-methyltransferase
MRPTLQLLEPGQIGEILAEAKRILSETGMEVRGPKLRQRLLDAGLPTGEGGRVLFPAEVVERAIASAPKSFTLFDRDGNAHAEIGGWNVHFTPGSSGLKVMDHRTGETRLANSADFVEYARLCDGLAHIRYLATAFSTNADIEPQVSDAWRLYMVLTSTKKPVVSGAFSEHGVPRMAAMMQLFRRDRADLCARPMSIFTITATGNFRFGEDSCQNLLDCVEVGIPVEIVPVTLMGLIAPVTLVGALVFHCVDVLAGITMAQVVKPGAPVLFGGAPATFHMRAASSPMAAIEAQRLNCGYVAIAKSLGLPTQAYMALSDGKFLDAQAGAETMTSAMLATLAGVNSVSGPGMLDFVLTFSLPKLVFDNEVCGQCLAFVREVRVLEDLPAAGLVEELRRNDHLITAPHTLKYWPQELYLTDPVIDRDNRETWLESGSKDLLARASEQVEKRLAAYVPVVTDAAVDAELRRLILSGLRAQSALPALPPPPEPGAAGAAPARRRMGRRRP